MPLASLKRRFMMKHMRGVLAATSATEQETQWQQAIHDTAERGTPLPSLALAFCRQHGLEAREADILTHFFGIGREHLFHSEGLLAGTDISTLTTLDDLLMVRAQKTLLWLPEDARPDAEAFIAEERQLYNLWLMNWQPGTQQAQRLIVSSLRHALHRLIETMAYEHLKDLIPGMGRAGDPARWGEQAASPGFDAICHRLASLIEEHITRLAPAYEGPGKVILGNGWLSPEQDTPQTDYIVLDPEAHTRIRLRHFERDVLRDVITTPYSTWEAEIRRQVSPDLRNQLAEIVTVARGERPTNVTRLDAYRSRFNAAAR